MKLRKDRRDERQREAVERNARWSALTPEQQVIELDRRGERAIKQRSKLAWLIAFPERAKR